MNYNKKTVLDVDVSGKKVLLRCDFNVPQDKETGEITSDKRIVAALPTIRYLLDNGAAVIACSICSSVAVGYSFTSSPVEGSTTADGRGIAVFGLFEVPATLTSIPDQADVAGAIHEYLAWALVIFAGLHALAALKHHFIDRDATLVRMFGRTGK